MEGPANQVISFGRNLFQGYAGFTMEEPSSQDSRDDLFYTTTTSDFLECTPYEVGKRVRSSFLDKFFDSSYAIFQKLRRVLGLSILAASYTSFDFLRFSFAYVIYIKDKVVDLGIFIEASKDKGVRTLMWRRGLLFRPATHGGVLALIVIAVVAGGLFSQNEIAAQDLTLTESALTLSNSPETIIPTDRPRSEAIKYEVAKGDTLSEIAEKFKVSVASVRWANDLSEEDTVKRSDTLRIPPVSGVIHKVKKGETIFSVAKKYEANPQAIADFPFNYIDQSLSLESGRELIVPGGVKPQPMVVPVPGVSPNPPPVNYAAAGSGLFAKPLSGPLVINQSPSWYHPAVDLGAPYGTGVYAAGSGRVITAKKVGTGFGWHILIDHGNGYVTTYAHLSDIKVNVGQNVKKGSLIGAVGCSGFCTGPHLHFEVVRNGAKINPFSVF